MISDARFSVRLAALLRKIKSEDATVSAVRRRITLYSLATEGDLTTRELAQRFGVDNDELAATYVRLLVHEGVVESYRVAGLRKAWHLTEYGQQVALDLLDREEDE